MNLLTRILDLEYWIWNILFGIVDPEYYLEYWIRNIGFGNIESGILDPEYWIWNIGSGILGAEYWNWNIRSGIKNRLRLRSHMQQGGIYRERCTDTQPSYCTTKTDSPSQNVLACFAFNRCGGAKSSETISESPSKDNLWSSDLDLNQRTIVVHSLRTFEDTGAAITTVRLSACRWRTNGKQTQNPVFELVKRKRKNARLCKWSNPAARNPESETSSSNTRHAHICARTCCATRPCFLQGAFRL